MENKIVCVIPARLNSSRFPGKILAFLGKKPLVQWAYEGAKACGRFDEIVIATDSVEVVAAARSFRARAIMTDRDCKTGTDRLIELQREGKLEGEIWVNWQGDEPFIDSEVIGELLQSIEEEDQQIWTLKKSITEDADLLNPHIVKVVTDLRGKALYFSRSPIPSKGPAFKHVGIYAFHGPALEAIGKLSPSPLEEAESLEQLRFLENGFSIQVHQTHQEIFGIDTKEELAIAEEMCYTRR